MQMAIFGDIHGNMPALKAVWADMDRRGIERRYCLGDLVGYGAEPEEVVHFMRAAATPTIMGNYDDGVGHSSADCGCAYRTEAARELGNRSIAWTNQRVSPAAKSYLRNLPMAMSLVAARQRVLLVHGSPRRINEYLYEDRPERSVARLFVQFGADVIVCGHTHLPYDRALPGGQRLINAGSVGKPKDGDNRAGYLLLAEGEGGLQVEFVRVSYDVEAAARLVEESGLPAEFAAMLRSGTG